MNRCRCSTRRFAVRSFLLLKLRDELGLTILIVTHDLGLAWTVADRVAVMYLGRIVEDGPAEKVLTHPQHPYTKALLAVVEDSPEGKRQTQRPILAGEPPDPSRIPQGCRFHPRCPEVASRRQPDPQSLCRRGPTIDQVGPRSGGRVLACERQSRRPLVSSG
jgi:oligopeptide/dipeptide ABC transporter ATP-binding protein